MRRPRIRALLLVLPAGLLASEASALRVMTYNILNYSAGRETEFREILAATQPDVLVVEEILSQAAVNRFRDSVLNVVNPGEWAAGPFVNGIDTDNAFFHRPARATFVSHFVIGTALRDIDEWTFRPASHDSAGANVRIYVVHLKASQGTDNEQKRLAEVTAMRARLETFPAGQSYIVAGDFNIYRSTEPAYQYLINPANGGAGVVQDPIGREGNWHVNVAFADVHTQSPRVTQFGGGANGGLDDRFDILLVAPSIQDGEGFDILDSTYTAFGQDSLHFDGALNVPPYIVVDASMAQDLHDASDHLPVFADFRIPPRLETDPSLDLGPVIVGGVAAADLPVSNVAPVPADELDYSFGAPPGFTAPAGSFTADAGDPPSLHSIGMSTAAPGIQFGDLAVTSDDPDHLSHLVPLAGTVLAHAVPSTSADSIALMAALDLGTIEPGDSASAGALVHNFPVSPFQALLEVYEGALTGDPRFFFEGGFSPGLVGASPGTWGIGFDGVGASDGPYGGTLTLRTRDQQDLDGAQDLADLVWTLSATVDSNPNDVVIGSSSVARTGIASVSPNPFRPSTSIRFALRTAGRVELRIYDVRGRAVRTLIDATRAAGDHREEWNGRDGAGRDLAPGIYFARFAADGVTETRKLVRLR